MTMKMTLSEYLGVNDWSNNELCLVIDDLGCTVEKLIHGTIKRDELIRDLWEAHDCGWCAMYDRCDHIHDERCLMYERIRELGIEVER